MLESLPELVKLLRRNFQELAWLAWGDVPIEQRDFWFNEFKVSDFLFIKFCYIC